MRTANPALQQFVQPQTWDSPGSAAASGTMTVTGTAVKSAILLAICSSVAVFAWDSARSAGDLSSVGGPFLGAALGGLVLALIISFKPVTAPFLAPIFAACEGVVVGVLSWYIPHRYNVGEAVVFQAAGLTFGILLALLVAYAAGLVRLGSTATKVIVVATAGVMVYYAAILLAGLFGFPMVNLATDTSALGIGFSMLVVVLASLNLVLDFQFIEAGIQRRAPKYMEWYGAFGLLVTLVWLYIETLRLLAKMKR